MLSGHLSRGVACSLAMMTCQSNVWVVARVLVFSACKSGDDGEQPVVFCERRDWRKLSIFIRSAHHQSRSCLPLARVADCRHGSNVFYGEGSTNGLRR
jgi:hypothetical protein